MDTQRRMRRCALIATVALALLTAACAPAMNETSAGAASSSKSQAMPVTSTHTPTVAPTTAPKPSTSAGQIRLSPSAAHYATSDTITVTVRNDTGKPAYAIAHFTGCSIILAERLVANSWQPVNPCVNGFPHPSVTQIAPAAETTVQLSPMAASSDAQADATAHWPAGTYRAEITYTSSQSAAFGTGISVFSSTFTVG